MKIWLKYLIAIGLGIALGLVLPAGLTVLGTLATISLNLARYALVPLIFFSLPIAAQELHEDKKLLRIATRTTLYAIASVFLLVLVGILGAFALSPGRIPLSADTASLSSDLPTISSLAIRLFPANAMSAVLDFDYLLPLAILGVVLGMAFSFDRTVTKPLHSLFDSASHVLWQINSFIVEIFPLPLIALAAARTVSLASSPRMGLYFNLIAVVVAEVVFVCLLVIPLVLYLVDRKSNPFKTLYGLLGPALLGLSAGHALAPAGALAKHLKESLGVRRRAGAVALPLALSFGRAGSAMVSATAFIVVLSSYSSLGLGSGTILWILGFVPLSALLLGAASASGPLAALLFLSASYGRGFESGYLLMVPAALPLMAAGTFLDTICAGCIVKLGAVAEGYTTEKPARHFI